jgi:capsular polysaccharide biosynthesis protein
VFNVEVSFVINSLIKGWRGILACTCLFAGAAALVCFLLASPVYQASTTVLVVPKGLFQQNSLMQYSDILTAHHQLTQIYQEIAQSRSVAEKVIELEKIQETPEGFKGRVSIQRLNNTELISILVKDKDPLKAQSIANTLTQVFMEKIGEIMKMDSLILVEEAALPEEPQEQKTNYLITVAGVVGFLLAVSRIILFLCLDSTIKTGQDAALFLNLPVLGVIPKHHGHNTSFIGEEKQ